MTAAKTRARKAKTTARKADKRPGSKTGARPRGGASTHALAGTDGRAGSNGRAAGNGRATARAGGALAKPKRKSAVRSKLRRATDTAIAAAPSVAARARARSIGGSSG